MKKAQISGLPLVLIFALIAGALILFWGISTIINLNEQAEYTQFADQILDLQTDIEIFSRYGEGATKKITITLPSKVSYLCFYDKTTQYNCLLNNQPCPEELSNYLQDAGVESKNIYIYPPEFKISYFQIDNLYPKNGNPECITNKEEATLQNTEDKITISYEI